MKPLLLEEFISCYGSATANLKMLSSDYSLDLLALTTNLGILERLVKVTVNQKVIMYGLSTTNIVNKSFVELLTDCGNIPIGVKLFGKNSLFKRKSMIVKNITRSNIDNLNIISLINEDIKNIYYRESIFIKNDEQMLLKEYFLPDLEVIINDYNKNIK